MLILLLATSFVFGTMHTASAQDLTTSACLQETYGSLGSSQRKFRGFVLGQKKSEDLPVGAVRFDTEFTAWTKTAADTWKNLIPDSETNSDETMDDEAEFADVKGILETRKTLTSDLLPPLLQAFRAFQCDSRARCMVAAASQRRDAPEEITVQPDGCISFTLPRMDSCQIEQAPKTGTGEKTPANFSEVKTGFCDKVRTSLVEHEAKALKFLVAYDASYRTVLQFAGSFQNFMTQLRGPLLFPLWEAFRALQTFGDEKCFNAQCDE